MLVCAQKQARSSASKALKQAAAYSTPSSSSPSSSSTSSNDALLAQTTNTKPSSPTVTNGPPRSTLATHVKLPTNLSSPPKAQILRPYRPRTPLFPSAARPKIQLPSGFGENQMVSLPDSTLSLLNTIVGSFKDAPIRYAFAYGSGIFAQGGPGSSPKEGEKPPMLDFIFAVTHADHFHSINMQNNPSHYPAYMRAMGSGAVSWIQQHGGAGVWFNADVPVEGVRIKYGVVTMDHLCKDLIEWQTLYLSGRMHKPIRIIKDDPRVKLANQVNLASALRVALLTLPENFSERELYTRIAGLSYGGDFRMSIPGAENPRKIHNIVDSQMDKFKGVYGRLLSELDGLAVVGVPGGSLHQDHSPEHRASLARKLPKTLKTGIRAKYADASRDQTESSAEKELWLKIGGEESLGHELIRQTSQITRRPALTQSIKGIITAGPLKSLHYSWAKVGKWQKGTKELEEAKSKEAAERL